MKTDPKSTDYINLVELLGIYTECSQRLDAIQNELDSETSELVETVRRVYASMQEKQGAAERAIIALCERHPEWLSSPRSIKTPCGTVSAKTSRKLVVASETSSIRLIEAQNRGTEFVRTVQALDLEALEKLEDHELAQFGITRATSENFTIKAAAIDLGKAVKTAAEKENAK